MYDRYQSPVDHFTVWPVALMQTRNNYENFLQFTFIAPGYYNASIF
jgi:hypothetical protein